MGSIVVSLPCNTYHWGSLIVLQTGGYVILFRPLTSGLRCILTFTRGFAMGYNIPSFQGFIK